MKMRGLTFGRIGSQLSYQIDEEKYWRNVSQRIPAVDRSSTSHGFPFEGHIDKFGSPHIINFKMTLELIAKFDPILVEYIKKMEIQVKVIPHTCLHLHVNSSGN
jgi:hypothetical protein